MDVTEAKKIYKDIINAQTSARTPDSIKALELGIEIFAYIESSRVAEPGSVPALFHGETERR